jgi:alkylation response protein AidB-like acyl-CoA dehydrogenase
VQFGLTQEQTLLRDAVYAFARDHYGDRERRSYRAQPSGYSAENWRLLAELGVLGFLIPGDEGGLGGGPRELITVMEVLGSVFAVEPVLEEIVIAGNLLARTGSREQKDAWLGRIVSGQAHLTLAHFEHASRFQTSRVQMQARHVDGQVLLEGDKAVVSMAATADQWIVSAREPQAGADIANVAAGAHGASGADGANIGFYLVAPTAAGIERRDFRMVDGSIASAIRFKAVRTNGRLGGNLSDFMATLDVARLAAGAEMVGIMGTLFSTTIEYLKNRHQFGVPLASFQALKHRLADLYVLLEQSRSHLLRAVACIGAGAAGERAIAGMKSYISRAATQIGEECVHLHGGIGMTDDLALGHGYKRLVLLASLFGDANSELVRYHELTH